MAKIKVSDVFGVRKEMVLSYLERDNVDGKFKEALDDEKHILVYGTSKQGKSALVQKHLKKFEYIPINCSPQMTIKDIYSSLLRQNDVEIETTTNKITESGGEIGFKTGFKALIPFLGQTDAEFAGKATDKKGNNVQYKHIEFNLEIAQDICEILKKIKFNKLIVIENFHYLKEDVQKMFAFDLRIFQDIGFRFVILGIWREKNRLLQFNRDLIDRVIEIPVEPWQPSDFDLVIKKGSKLLSVEFSTEILAKIKEVAFGNVGIVQELCKELCFTADIKEEQDVKYIFNDIILLEKAIQIKLDEYSASHLRSLESIAGASKQTNGLFMPFYLVKILVQQDVNVLIDGIDRKDLLGLFKNVHYRPQDVRPSDITYLLNNLAELQVKNMISPPLFDYDSVGRKLRIIDSTLMFFLKFKDRQEIMDEIIDPSEQTEV